MNYCSHCGSRDINSLVPPSDNMKRLVCGACGTVHYENPRIIAGCLPVFGRQVLLCKRAIEPRKGYWNLPAGFMEKDETLEEGAAREVMEEAKARVIIKGLHAVFCNTTFHHVYFHFLGEIVNGEFGVGEESEDSRLFYENEIPWSELAFDSSVFALERYFQDQKEGLCRVHVGSNPGK